MMSRVSLCNLNNGSVTLGFGFVSPIQFSKRHHDARPQRVLYCPGAYLSCTHCFHRGPVSRFTTTLSQNCQERRCVLPTRMVPFCLCYNWRLVSGKKHISNLDCSHFRSQVHREASFLVDVLIRPQTLPCSIPVLYKLL